MFLPNAREKQIILFGSKKLGGSRPSKTHLVQVLTLRIIKPLPMKPPSNIRDLMPGGLKATGKICRVSGFLKDDIFLFSF